jgi:hypothetical protein
MSNQAHPISVLIAQFQELHGELLLEVANRYDESLNWARLEAAAAATRARSRHRPPFAFTSRQIVEGARARPSARESVRTTLPQGPSRSLRVQPARDDARW